MAMPRRDAGVRNHGPDDEYPRWGTDGYARLGRAWVSADRNGTDVRADGRLPLGAMADADLQAAKRGPSETRNTCRDHGSWLRVTTLLRYFAVAGEMAMTSVVVTDPSLCFLVSATTF
jgi:hypothetical protein